jgi:hypothetical protein
MASEAGCFWVAPIDPLPPELIPLDEEEIFSGKFRSPKWIWKTKKGKTC